MSTEAPAQPITPSRARQLAIGLGALLQAHIDQSRFQTLGIQVRPLWHPSFASKQEVKTAIMTVRPASRGRNASGVVTGVRDVMMEIGIVKALPKPKTKDADPYNDHETIDCLDALAEETFDLFCRVDEEEYPAPAGKLSETDVCGYVPRTPTQPEAISNELLESDRVFLTVITVPYQRME